MALVNVINQNGEKVDSIELEDQIFNAEIRDSLVQQVVVWQLAKRRSSCASTKTRGQIRGGGKKPWRQKGTGRARAGTSRSPIWTGGGTIFGPHPRSYAFTLSKKVRKAAICSVLSAKLRDDKLTVLDKIEIEAPKTKLFMEVLKKLGIQDQKTLFLIPEKDPELTRASKNIYRALVLPSEGLNVYDLLRFERLAIFKDTLPKLSERLS